MDSTTCEAIPVQTFSLVLWLCNESESQCGTQFEHDLSKSLIKISLVFRITPRKCQLGKPLINDKTAQQLCLIFCVAAIITPLRCAEPPLCCIRAWAAGLRGEAAWLPARPRSEFKENDSASASDSPVSWFIAETRALCRGVHAFPCIYTRAEDCSTVAPFSTLNLEMKEVMVTLWLEFLKSSTVVLSQKKKKPVQCGCEISFRARREAEREMAVDVGSYRSAVNSNSRALLLPGSGHFEILLSLCTLCMCVYVWLCANVPSLFSWDACATTQRRGDSHRSIRALRLLKVVQISCLGCCPSSIHLWCLSSFPFSLIIIAPFVIAAHTRRLFCAVLPTTPMCIVHHEKSILDLTVLSN